MTSSTVRARFLPGIRRAAVARAVRTASGRGA